MAEPGGDANAEVPSSPPPSFTSLPDVAHHTIASFLPDGDIRRDNRLRVSEVSRALFECYGVSLDDFEGGTNSGLTALLRRQKRLKTIVTPVQRAFLGLSRCPGLLPSIGVTQNAGGEHGPDYLFQPYLIHFD
jgi:hypothetical protein